MVNKNVAVIFEMSILMVNKKKYVAIPKPTQEKEKAMAKKCILEDFPRRTDNIFLRNKDTQQMKM